MKNNYHYLVIAKHQSIKLSKDKSKSQSPTNLGQLEFPLTIVKEALNDQNA